MVSHLLLPKRRPTGRYYFCRFSSSSVAAGCTWFARPDLDWGVGWCAAIHHQGSEEEEGGQDLSFNESQGLARANMVKTARQRSKEVEIEVRGQACVGCGWVCVFWVHNIKVLQRLFRL